MSAEQDRDEWLRSAFGPQPATPAPVEPPEWHLRRIEAAAALVHEAVREKCRHCRAEPVVLSVWPMTGLARAVEWRHEPGCPDEGA